VAPLLVVKLAVLSGAISIGPVTPVCRIDMPCDKPGAQVKLTFTRNNHVFATRTDASGKYRIKLAPGIYAVRASAGMSMRPRNINVRAPSTKLDFSIDTGIR
jgi:hypothetical protein